MLFTQPMQRRHLTNPKQMAGAPANLACRVA